MHDTWDKKWNYLPNARIVSIGTRNMKDLMEVMITGNDGNTYIIRDSKDANPLKMIKI